MEETKKVYADNAATTRPSESSVRAMTECLTEEYGNPSSIYRLASGAKRVLSKARDQVAAVLNAEKPAEIFFTSGGTEADNWAIRGAMLTNARKGKHLITSKIEHHAVLTTVERLEKEGYDVTYLDVDSEGLISLDALREAIRPDTVLVTVMAANNEIGTIEPVAEIGAICREKGVLFHTDAVQAAGHIPLDVRAMKIDLLSLSAHKFHGAKGAGALYIRSGVRVANLIEGGGQERGKRSGTENVPAIAAMGVALEEAAAHMEAENARLDALRARLDAGVLKLPEVFRTGSQASRLHGTASYCVKYIEGESMVLLLDNEGIQASSGSACSSGSLDPSHVLMAIGLTHEAAHGSLRLSLGRYNTEEDVDYILEKLPKVVDRLRAMSPVWKAPVQ